MSPPPIEAVTEETRYGAFLDLHLLRRFFRYAKPHTRWVLLALAILPLNTLIQLGQPLLLRQAVDEHLIPGTLDGFAGLLVALGVLLLLQALAGYGMSVVNATLGQRVVRDLRRDLFGHLLRLDASYFNKHASGRTTNRVTNDVEAVSQMVSAGLIHLIGDVVLLTGILISMALLAPTLSLTLVVALPLIVGGTLLAAKKSRLAQRENRLMLARMASRLTEEIEGQQEVRLFHRQQRNHAEFEQQNQVYFTSSLVSNTWEAFQFSFIDALSTVVIAALFWIGASMSSADGVTIGTLVAFIDYVRRVFQPVRDLSGKFTTMQAAMTALERIFGLLDSKPQITDAQVNHAFTLPARPRLVMQEVGFAYGEQPILKNLSLTVEPGEQVAVVGPTGAGKSTLIKLLNRTYEPQQGIIQLGGQDLQNIPMATLRRTVGVVPQETFLFSGTIAENIHLRDPSIPQAAVEEAAHKTGAMAFIADLPEGLNTRLTERGGNLSSGQRQLLGITRAFVFNPALLILDEATSSVDTISERLIQNALQELMVGRTAIVIAHRLNTIIGADRVIVMHGGEIIQGGSHQTLVTQPGLYRKLCELQFGLDGSLPTLQQG
ncbi:ABC transporter related protein [Magnetococcus marinus MC-1]|uniref:ABC transporter related protein n=1 Tax=Magnetococcus marinus (strain ATCC BAA-1437 / JCM 17883 / MC-1) TaxID=156889 RepID=A0L7N3_MAGMM|nr:ABC transporter ATP-binding protein [Magnetococcus marinus]ABK43976.1 ABC transporter related protein [Magnetococcus marinus MC-1]